MPCPAVLQHGTLHAHADLRPCRETIMICIAVCQHATLRAHADHDLLYLPQHHVALVHRGTPPQ